MLKKFEVRNFKQFDSLVFDFSCVRNFSFATDCTTASPGRDEKLVKTALVFGRTGSGKSNLIEALFDIRGLFDTPKPTKKSQAGRSSFSYTFLFDGTEVTYSYVKAGGEVVRERLAVADKEYFCWDREMKTERIHCETASEKPGSSLLCEALSDENSFCEAVVKFARSMVRFRAADEKAEQMVLAGRINELESFLKRFGIEERFEEATDAEGVKRLCFKGYRALSVIENSSSGLFDLIGLFCCLETETGLSFFAADDFSAHLDHRTEGAVFRYLKEKTYQAVLTAHATHLLSHAQTRPDCCFDIGCSISEAREEDCVLKSFADSTCREIREGNNLEKLYLAGEFG